MIASLWLQGMNDLRQRYSHAFRNAWRQRHAMAAPKRLPHEAQFLPAALSLQETPTSPAPRVTMWLLIAFTALALAWAMLGQVDVVVTAEGKIVPSDRSKTIQPQESGTVTAIHVTDGQQVKAGDILIELDATVANADRERIDIELAAAKLEVSRWQSLIDVIGSQRAPTLPRPAGVDDDKFTAAQRLLSGQVSELSAKLVRIDADIAQRQAEMQSTIGQQRKLEQTVPIARQREQDLKALIGGKFVSQHEYLEREQVRIEQEAELAIQHSRLGEIEAALSEVRGQRLEVLAATRRESLDSLTTSQQRLAGLEQELLKADSRDRLMKLLSPVDGTVQQLAMHTIGGVVTPAQPLMVIVPREDRLEIEAFIENKDIGFVRAMQDAQVKVETYQYTKYGTIPALVVAVSHDAISDEQRGLIYAMRVAMVKSTLRMEGTEIALTPGMAVSVEIKTGKRRVIDYFLSPLQQHVGESLRER